jgi:hypothetical protein
MTEPNEHGELPIVDLDDFLGFIAAQQQPTVDQRVADALSTVSEGYDVLLELTQQNLDRLDNDGWTQEQADQWADTYVATATRIQETSAGSIAPFLTEVLAYVTLLYVKALETVYGDGCGCDGLPLPKPVTVAELLDEFRTMADHNLVKGGECLRQSMVNDAIKPLDPDAS